MLLRAGISKDARTKVDKTPVHIAAQEGHSDVLELLLKNGSDVEAVDMVRFESLDRLTPDQNLYTHVLTLLLTLLSPSLIAHFLMSD